MDKSQQEWAAEAVVAANARQSAFFASADRDGTNDRADVTGGSGYSRYDYEGGAE